MSDITVRVEKLSKKFLIGKKQASYNTLRDSIAEAVVAPFRKAGRLLRGQSSGASGLDEEIWALKDLSFEIKRGEAVGFIGSNGAGKSTLLKILSRITEPTNGYAEIKGRVGSLLEVGTGFHPELTGRENIYLNGAILGMKRAEISRKFDEIVAFAEIDKFIDTPVKHYSSGMYLRLAFGVAAHLEPEILIVDEVLAVGDARFQQKCLNKMEDVGREGRTVLFVSHNMPAVTRLCQRAILLDKGIITKDGLSREVVSSYLLSDSNTTAERVWSDPSKAPGSDVVRLHAVRVKTKNDLVVDLVDISRPFGVEIEYEVCKSGYILLPIVYFINESGLCLFESSDTDPAWRRHSRPEGHWTSTVWIPENLLSEGTISVTLSFVTFNPVIGQFKERNVVSFRVVDNNDGESVRGDWLGKMDGGVVRPLLKWVDKQMKSEKVKSI
ncbi:MAG: polysaccharide ABC transporter ATP-binding protein [Thermodesulfovibrionales bacterium]